MADKNNQNGNSVQDKVSPKKYGTFFGVYLPSVLTILGVIMYLRIGWVVGHAGIWNTIFIVFISSLITYITTLSISAIATNMQVKGGGAYYMVSRSFGVEAGAAVGLPLYLAQVVGIAFYLAGFAESVATFFPDFSQMQLAMIALLVMALIAYISTSIVLKTQFIIFIIIIASLVSLFFGHPPKEGFDTVVKSQLSFGFWEVFAVFFPAVTGILSGVSMSGDLENPGRSLPRGTLAAVATGFAIYIIIPIFLVSFIPMEVLRQEPMIIYKVALIRQLILLGIWGATLSSAFSSFLSAPRTMQAMAQDHVLPRVMGKGFGSSSEPRLATLVTFIIAVISIYFGDLNSIAPVLTMFFLTAYGALNLIAGIEGLMGNPSWRPVMQTPWIISIIGAALCFAAMLMINSGATIIAVLIVAGLYYWVTDWQLGTGWADMRHGLLITLARFSIYRLAKYKPNAKSWRPNIFVLSGAPTQRWHLIHLAHALSHGKGFLTVAAIVQKEEMERAKIDSMEASIYAFLKERKVAALVEVNYADKFMAGAKELVKSYGMGPLSPNTFVFGEIQNQENFISFAKLIRSIHQSRRNILIYHEGDGTQPFLHANKKIVCWWRGQNHNAEFMLTLGYMFQTGKEWHGAGLTIKTIVETVKSRDPIAAHMENYIRMSRINANVEVIVDDTVRQEQIAGQIKNHSIDADLILLGMRSPLVDETPEAYARYYVQFMESIKDFPPTLIVLSAEDIDFNEILN